MKKQVKYLIVIAGPTAVGKSALALHLSDRLGTEIISADSRQIYQEMNIGTAKPLDTDLKRIKHHFVDELSIRDTFSAAMFEEQGLKRLGSIFQKQDLAIMCGGTGLYIKALCEGLDQIPDVDVKVRYRYDQQYLDEGIESLQDKLRKLDPEYSEIVDMANHRRLIRALSVIKTTGRSFSSFLQSHPQKRPFKCINILLTEERKTLYERINNRVEKMIENGLEQEVLDLLVYKDHQTLQTVGYQEWFPYFEKTIDRSEVIRLIKRNTRRYAKRQVTWFRKYDDWKSFAVQDWSLIETYINDHIKT